MGKTKAEKLIYMQYNFSWLKLFAVWQTLGSFYFIDQYPPWEGSQAFWLKLFFFFFTKQNFKKREL
jgi:hypothetical protein